MTRAGRQITKNMPEGLCIKVRMQGPNLSSGLSRALTVGVILLLSVATAQTAGAQTAGAPIPHGTLELIAEDQWIAVGRKLYLGLRFQLEKGWHIYWVNPGDSGEPPRVDWQLPTGLTAGAIEWPTPRRFEASTIVDFGYENTVMLMVQLHAEPSLAAQQKVRIGATNP